MSAATLEERSQPLLQPAANLRGNPTNRATFCFAVFPSMCFSISAGNESHRSSDC
jgi:hypothetical protein